MVLINLFVGRALQCTLGQWRTNESLLVVIQSGCLSDNLFLCFYFYGATFKLPRTFIDFPLSCCLNKIFRAANYRPTCNYLFNSFRLQKGTSDFKETEAVKVPVDQLNEEDNRFEIPTDQSIQSKTANEVIYSDGVIPNSNANNSELFTTQSNDLDTRLK